MLLYNIEKVWLYDKKVLLYGKKVLLYHIKGHKGITV